jgi:flagellar export protein FliJ
MPFRFALAPLLRLRQSLERQRSLRLREASLAVARAHQTLSRLEQFLADSALSDHAALSAGRSAAELQFALVSRDRLHGLRQKLQTELSGLELERQRAAEEYQHAYREREVLDTLGTRQRDAYHQEERQREQHELDAAHLLRLWRKRLD